MRVFGFSNTRNTLSNKLARLGSIGLAMAMLATLGLATSCSNSENTASSGAAAQFNGSSYVYEQDVTDYIETYKTSQGYGQSDDATWATYLKEAGLTPESLREKTIRQLAEDQIAQQKASELGIEVTDEEVQEQIDSLKSYFAFQDDSVWASTLEMYGTTEDEVRETYRLQILKDKLVNQEVPYPEPTDDEVLTYAKTFATSLDTDEHTTKHSYCFKLSADEGGSLTNSTIANQAHDQLAADGALSVENFAVAVSMYSDNEELIESTGANGWDLDSSEYGQNYQNYLEVMDVGDLSEVFVDDDGCYTFIYVDTSYRFPSSASFINSMTLDDMPDSLRSYMKDSCAYTQWYTASKKYLPGLLDQANLVIYDMPSGLPYDVDMSLAENTSNTSANSSNSAVNANGNTANANANSN